MYDKLTLLRKIAINRSRSSFGTADGFSQPIATGDLNNDGVADLVIGANTYENNSDNSAAYVIMSEAAAEKRGGMRLEGSFRLEGSARFGPE